MTFRIAWPAIIGAVAAFFIASPALAQVVITQAKALAGNVTSGDTPGYPITLSQPGAYVLASNLTVTPGTYGLFVTANNVDIDMRGFTLSGAGGGTYGLISGFGESSLHGGVITRFRNSGIYLRNNAWMIENMKIVRNGSMGIDATGTVYTTVRNSFIASNAGLGMWLGETGRVEKSIVSENGGNGITCFEACYIDGNTVKKNGGIGIRTTSAVLIGNTVVRNVGDGIFDNTSTGGSGSANGMMFNNDTGSADFYQSNGVAALNPNRCIGKTC